MASNNSSILWGIILGSSKGFLMNPLIAAFQAYDKEKGIKV